MITNLSQWLVNIPNASRISFVLNQDSPAFYKKLVEIFVAELGGHLPFRILNEEELANALLITSEIFITFEASLELLKMLNQKGSPQILNLAGPTYCLKHKLFSKLGLVDINLPFASEDDIDELLDLFHRSLLLADELNFPEAKQRALFLDRDGVVIKDVPYNTEPQYVELTPQIDELINEAHRKNYWVTLVTNQSGIGRGRVNSEQYLAIHLRMTQLLAEKKAWIDEWIHAPYFNESPQTYYHLSPQLRKPRSGMILSLANKLNIDTSKSILIGDSASDIFSAHWAKVGQKYLFNTDKTSLEIELIKQFEAELEPLAYKTIAKFSEVIL